MKKSCLLLLFMISVFYVNGKEPLKDYSFIRGVCYPGGWMQEQTLVERDLGYAKRLQLNSTRIWLNYRRYLNNPADFKRVL